MHILTSQYKMMWRFHLSMNKEMQLIWWTYLAWKFHWGMLHNKGHFTRDWEPVTSTLQALSLVGKAETVQVRFTLCLRDQRSTWMQDGSKGHFTHKPWAVTMKLWEPKRKCPKAVPTHLQNHVVWSWILKCSVKSYVTGPQPNAIPMNFYSCGFSHMIK